MRIPLDRESPTPLFRQVEGALRTSIASGALAPGTDLPSTRVLAGDLGVARITVGSAYAALERDGLVEGRVGAGTRVAAAPPAAPGRREPSTWPRWQQELAVAPMQAPDETAGPVRPGTISFTGVGDLRLLAVADLSATVRDVLRQDGVAALGYDDLAGHPGLRTTVARLLAAQGVHATAEQVLVTSGSQQGLALVAQALLRPGDAVLVEEPTYDHALRLFAHLGVRVVGAPMDADGLRVDAVEDLVRRYRPRLVYTVPTFHNPTGTCLPLARRRELLRLAAEHDLAVVEDDFAGDLRYDGRAQPPVMALDRDGVVIHLGTFSKVLAPGLRVGYVVADGPVLARLTALKRASDLTTSPLVQRVVERFVTVGRYQAHLRRTTRTYRRRRDALLDAVQRDLPGWRVQRPPGGLFAWARLPEGTSASRLARAALDAGVVVAPGTRFFPDPADGEGHVRLNFATLTEDEIAEGVLRLARAAQRARGR